MSPSEFQLRAALSDGEGDGPDPDAIIGAALQLRHDRRDRRVRLAGMAAAVVLVGGVGGGIALSHTIHHRSTATASRPGVDFSADDPHAAAGGEVAGTTNGAGSVAGGTASGGSGARDAGSVPSTSKVAECPSRPASYRLPGGGGTDQFGANGPLFSAPVTRLVICSYAANGDLSSRTESGSAAAATARRLEASQDAASGLQCLTPAHLELLPFGAGGAQTPLVATGTCHQLMVTNGTAVRYVPLGAL